MKKPITIIFEQTVFFLRAFRSGGNTYINGTLILTDDTYEITHSFSGVTGKLNQESKKSGLQIGDNIGHLFLGQIENMPDMFSVLKNEPLIVELEQDGAPFTCISAPLLDGDERKGYLVYFLPTAFFSKFTDLYKGIIAACANFFEVQMRSQNIIVDLSQTNKSLSNILRFVPDACIIFDRNGLITQINEAATTLLETYQSPKNRAILGHHYQEFLKTKSISFADWITVPLVNQQMTLRSINGQTRKVFVTTSIIKDSSGAPEAIVNCIKNSSDVQKLVNHVTGNSAHYTFNDIIHNCAKISDLISFCGKIANSPHPILIESESGTGKELFAQAIHNASDRNTQPFVVVDCSSIPSELLESDLFGYASGSFTGAAKTGKIGKITLANKGTVFFDEIGELPLHLQSKLLRFIQFKTFTPVGGTTMQHADVRIIAATNRILQEEVHKQNFRHDLYYRLNIFNIQIPPLRHRLEDIPYLVNYFINKNGSEFFNKNVTISPDALALMMDYDWPGNVRELENTLIRALATCDEVVLPRHLNIPTNQQTPPDLDAPIFSQTDVSCPLNLDTPPCAPLLADEGDAPVSTRLNDPDHEQELILAALKQTNGNKLKTANLLGVSRTTLYKKIAQYGL